MLSTGVDVKSELNRVTPRAAGTTRLSSFHHSTRHIPPLLPQLSRASRRSGPIILHLASVDICIFSEYCQNQELAVVAARELQKELDFKLSSADFTILKDF